MQDAILEYFAGISLNASFMLVFDLFAERRGAVYLTALTKKAP
jgi:hypothetical protein